MRLGSDLQSERDRGSVLEAQLIELSSKLQSSEAEVARLREELAEKGASEQQLRQEVRARHPYGSMATPHPLAGPHPPLHMTPWKKAHPLTESRTRSALYACRCAGWTRRARRRG